MSDRDALLAAILADPDDDTARLVYADWLQENGREPRAQFIREQVWAAQAEPYSKEARRHAAAANRLLEDGNRGEWARAVRQRVLAWEFRRGFVEHAAVNVATFPRDAAAIFRAEPLRSLQPVRFVSESGTVSLLPFFEVPQLRRVARLDFSGLHVSPVELEPLASCPHLANLTDLCLRDAPVMPDWLAGLLAGDALPALAGLDLTDLSHLGPRLASCLPRLERRRLLRLNLSGVVLASHELKAVLDSRCVAEVEELRFGWLPRSGRDGPLSHVNPGWAVPWGRLRLLDLAGQRIGDDGLLEIVKALTRRPGEAHLRWLGLENNAIGSEGVRALLAAPDSKLRLTHLDVRGNGLRLPQLAALQSRFPDAVIDA